jgi:hypothetical protein
MYSMKTNVFDIAKKQYQYKMKAYMWFIFSLIPLHVLALLLSMNGVASSGSGNNFVSINMNLYSNEIFIVFTLLWIFFGAVTLTTKAYRTNDFSFVSNRLSSNLSNIMYLLTLSFLGSVTCFLSGYLLRFIIFFMNADRIILNEAFTYSLSELFFGIIVTTFYMMLISAISYFYGMLIQLFKPFVLLLPAFFVWSLFFTGTSSPLLEIIEFFVTESSFVLFTIKIFIIVTILYLVSILISNRTEVR